MPFSLPWYTKTRYPRRWQKQKHGRLSVWMCFPVSGLCSTGTLPTLSTHWDYYSAFKGFLSVTSPNAGSERGDASSHFRLVSISSSFFTALILSNYILWHESYFHVLLSSPAHEEAANLAISRALSHHSFRLNAHFYTSLDHEHILFNLLWNYLYWCFSATNLR